MSSGNRTTSKGGKGAKPDKAHKDKDPKAVEKQQPKDVKPEDYSVKEKVKQLAEMTQKSEDEVVLVLHDCDYDLNIAINALLESSTAGEWEKRVKKKKNRQASATKADKADEGNGEDWGDVNTGGGDKEKPRGKPPQRMHNRDSRGWRGREKQENERNLEDGRQDYRRGRSSGGVRGGGGGRGRGGGRAGGRYPPRGNRDYNKPIETWNSNNTWDNNQANTNHTEDTWGDEFPGTDEWSSEEYTGETKVFSKSVQPELDTITEPAPEQPANQAALPAVSPVPLVGRLNAEQTQYLSQLAQQNSDRQGFQAQGFEKAGQVYGAQQQYSAGSQGNSFVNSAYGAQVNSGGYAQEQPQTQQPTRAKTQRARVPPPSKIPSSAVEMPGELNNMVYLDVQFGAMDFMDNNSFENDGKFSSGLEAASQPAGLDLNPAAQNMDAYSPKGNAQSSISSAITQSLSNNDSIPQTSEHLPSAAYTASRGAAQSGGAQAAPAALELSKGGEPHAYSQPSYNSYQSKSSYNTSSYTTTTTSSSYATQNTFANNQSQYNASAYQNSYSNAAYQNASFPSISQAAGSYQGSQAYPQNTSQSVYGGNAGLNSGSGAAAAAAASNFGNAGQYNSYTGGNRDKLKDGGYEGGSSAVSSSAQPVTNSTSSVTSSAALSLAQTTASAAKPTTTLAAKNSSSVVSNMPPGVPPVMSTPYMIGQVPYFQPPVYSYEEMQMLQQRLPHMTTPYYDMSYQTPTTLAAVRDGALGNVGYSISDARFTRGDNNASPVPSTLSQQTSTLTQGHQAQPILAGGAPPYFFATAFNALTPNYQFGTMYTQLPAGTNAHGASNSSQYPKPAAYGTNYGTSYDTLNQTQDYKGGYAGNTQAQKSAANASSTGSAGNDLSVYGKTHNPLSKVNSYDKQGFHSGTPPPFTGTLHGSQNAGLAPTGSYPQVYIPAMAPHHQQHSTPLIHQPHLQMDARRPNKRSDSGNSSGQRSQASNQAKGGAKQAYQASYWPS